MNVSIIIPVYNDPQGLRTTVTSILQSEQTTDCELLLVDNNSSDNTADVITALESNWESVTGLEETHIQSSYAARNTGIRNASSDILAFVDADMTVLKDWLESALDTFQSTGADYMGCNVELTPPEDPPLPSRYDRHTGFPVEQYLEHQHFAPTCCLFVRRDVFEDVGLFDHRLISGGDKEFGNRVHEAGYDVHFANDVTMYHPTRNTLPEHIKKDIRVGRGLCQLQRYHPERYGTPGNPPSPTGVKSPDPELPFKDRLAFGTLSRSLTGVRGLGYVREYLRYRRSSEDESLGEIPQLER
ncbi:glycosyltransferase [Halobacteria archaeon AArc-m2/3/4]|uniref:Glycosyltransferase n=1 Tax=Natronoglomus mannanivorans TaxID=2979990 RepID=A0ABT2QDK6_9EURY|nr:glycosyltransferase [Halobacteria archaeon AArc-m2/3/4]